MKIWKVEGTRNGCELPTFYVTVSNPAYSVESRVADIIADGLDEAEWAFRITDPDGNVTEHSGDTNG